LFFLKENHTFVFVNTPKTKNTMAKIYKPEDVFKEISLEEKIALKILRKGGVLKKAYIAEGDVFNLKA